MDRKSLYFATAVAGSLLLSACATTAPTDPDTVAQNRQQMQDLRTEQTNTDRRRVMDQRDLRNQRDRVQASDTQRANALNVDP